MIDLHAHVVLAETLGAAGPWGPELDEGDAAAGRPPCYRIGDYQLLGVRYRDSPFMDVDRRLAEMEARGIDLQVLSPNPLTYLPHIDADAARAFSRRHNDALADLIAPHRDRLAGLAQLPTQDPEAAVAELYRSVTRLGLLGACIGTDLDRPLDHPAYDPIYRACVELDVPLFLHPTPGGIDAPRRDERLARFDADLWIGFAHEEVLAVATVVLGGVLTRHPDLDLCISHGGGTTTWLADRMAHAAATRPWASDDLRQPGAVEALLGRLWWDTHVGGPTALDALVQARGTDHLVGGTNFAGWDQAADPAWGDPALAATLDVNARRLLRLDR